MFERPDSAVWPEYLRRKYFRSQASYAQVRYWLDEQIRFDQSSNERALAVYHMPVLFEIKTGQLSVERLQSCLDLLVKKHSVLRTKVEYDSVDECLKQYVKPVEECCFKIEQSFMGTKQELDDILLNEETNQTLFSLSEGIVCRCHLICHSNKNHDGDCLSQGDIILFNFHHCAMDGYSIDELFMRDLQLAYENKLMVTADNNLNYIDYSIYEKEMDMNDARKYWMNLLEGFEMRRLLLPYDHESEVRTGRGAALSFSISTDVVQHMIHYAHETNVTMFQLCLALYYLFLFKLTNERDLCVGFGNANRYRQELQTIMGTFANPIPFRCQLDPRETFAQLLQRIKERCLEIMEFSHMPYQEITKLYRDSHDTGSLYQTMFLFKSSTKQDLHFANDEILVEYTERDLSYHRHVSKLDLTLSVDSDIKKKTISCFFEYSLDLFDPSTIAVMSGRFQVLLKDLFKESLNVHKPQPLYEVSLLLSSEIGLLHEMNETYVECTNMKSIIHQQFVEKAYNNSQKVAVILDEQSLTYSELLHSVQHTALCFITEYNVRPKQIVCQCLQRSIDMVIGVLSILTAGAIYCPLNPNDPPERLRSLVGETGCRHVVVDHHLRKDIFMDHQQPSPLQFLSIKELAMNNGSDKINHERRLKILSDVQVAMENMAYLILHRVRLGNQKRQVFFFRRQNASFTRCFSHTCTLFALAREHLQVITSDFNDLLAIDRG
ncbi:unnamed protein product [Didymodactylos carnosus]|uniref:Uncharacterized protein n=1 Tax=Didymodactylos carnosus TaxID=1234261 RepID=A0A814CBB7_9BILA|nr:unnamed protein product [Didymodactylos carnosus]CAF3715369.1 unnamed protein product [Didymodactylos carnosus]